MVNQYLAIASKTVSIWHIFKPKKADNLVYRSLKIAVIIPAFNESPLQEDRRKRSSIRRPHCDR